MNEEQPQDTVKLDATLTYNGRPLNLHHDHEAPMSAPFDPEWNCPTHFAGGDPTCPACIAKQPAPMSETETETETRQEAWAGDMRVTVTSSPTADCDVSTVSVETLRESSLRHIDDVRAMLSCLAGQLKERGLAHDWDKIVNVEWFHRDFRTKFTETGWWDRHRRIHRHHLAQPDGVPDDVNLIDVLEYVVDCVMAGKARTGEVYPLTISDEVLRRAFENTTQQLADRVEVVR